MIVGVQAIPTCFDVEQQPFSCPPEALEVHFQAYDTLLQHSIRSDSGGYRSADRDTLQPGLAQAWDVSADGRTYSFQLRRSVASASGSELSAHDVRWSWERAFALGSWSARAARACGISSPDVVRVVHSGTVQFKLEQPHPLFPGILAGAFPAIYDMQDVRRHCATGDDWGKSWLLRHTAGFGSFALEDVIGGEEASLAANPRYWQGAAREKRVLLRAVVPGEARGEALARGSVDVAADLPASSIRKLASAPSVRIVRFPGQRQVVLRLDPAFTPFDQPRVRQALALALPFDEIAAKIYGVREARPFLAAQDQRTARTLLREAGYASGFRVSLCLPQDSADLLAIAHLIQLDGMRMNLKVVVEPMNPAVFAREKAGRHLPAYLEEHAPLTPLLPFATLDPLPNVHSVVLAEPPHCFAARSNVDGFVRRPSGRPHYVELRKA